MEVGSKSQYTLINGQLTGEVNPRNVIMERNMPRTRIYLMYLTLTKQPLWQGPYKCFNIKKTPRNYENIKHGE